MFPLIYLKPDQGEGEGGEAAGGGLCCSLVRSVAVEPKI